MRRREFIVLVGGVAASGPRSVRARPPERVRRIVFLHGLTENDPEVRARIAAFRQGLETLGWTENHNIQIEHRFSGDDFPRIQAYTAELVDSAPDLIIASSSIASSSPVLAALKHATRLGRASQKESRRARCIHGTTLPTRGAPKAAAATRHLQRPMDVKMAADLG
jgi:hypothetical protein